jgi:hypothetical protein
MKRVSLLVAMLVALFVVGCGAGQAPPETQVAHYETTVLGAATALQKGITAATDAKSLPVPIAQQLTGYVEQVYATSGKLNTALVAYHAAATLDLRKIQAAQVQQLVAELNTILSQILGVAIPPGAGTQIVTLAGQVIGAIGAVQAEIAKGLGQ